MNPLQVCVSPTAFANEMFVTEYYAFEVVSSRAGNNPGTAYGLLEFLYCIKPSYNHEQ